MTRLILLCILIAAACLEISRAESPFTWNGDYAYNLAPSGIEQNDGKYVATCSADPTIGAGLAAPVGSLCQYDSGTTGVLFLKTGVANTAWTDMLSAISGVPAGRTINTTTPLQGGGNLSANRTFSITMADSTTDGYLNSVDWNIFNNKQPAGNYITSLTGDGTASGPGAAALTLATVNSNVGSYTNASITVDGKGRITAASNGATPVTAVSVASANGFAGSSSGGATPALTLSTTVTGILQGNGTAISAASTTGTGDVVLATSPTIVTPTIAKLANLTSNGYVKTSSGDGTLSVQTAPIPVADGGTGQTTYTNGQLLIGNTTGSTLAKSTLTEGIGIDIANGAGTITISQEIEAPVNISGTDIDWSLVGDGGKFYKTLSANTTFTFSNTTDGQTIIVKLLNTASNYTVTWPTVLWSGGAAPTITVGAKTSTCTFIRFGSDIVGSCVLDMY